MAYMTTGSPMGFRDARLRFSRYATAALHALAAPASASFLVAARTTDRTGATTPPLNSQRCSTIQVFSAGGRRFSLAAALPVAPTFGTRRARDVFGAAAPPLRRPTC